MLTTVAVEQEVIFAYKPVWATKAGGGRACRRCYADVKGGMWGSTARFLYGGSAGPGMFEAIREGIDGLFLGRFAHDPEVLGGYWRGGGAISVLEDESVVFVVQLDRDRSTSRRPWSGGGYNPIPMLVLLSVS